MGQVDYNSAGGSRNDRRDGATPDMAATAKLAALTFGTAAAILPSVPSPDLSKQLTEQPLRAVSRDTGISRVTLRKIKEGTYTGHYGRPPLPAEKLAAIKASLKHPVSLASIARAEKVARRTVQLIAAGKYRLARRPVPRPTAADQATGPVRCSEGHLTMSLPCGTCEARKTIAKLRGLVNRPKTPSTPRAARRNQLQLQLNLRPEHEQALAELRRGRVSQETV